MNVHDYLRRQNAEYNRSFIIHYPAQTGKTRFARRICETREDAYLFDLLSHFVEHPDLPPIQRCSVAVLKSVLLKLNISQRVLIVDNPDFLINTWSPDEKEEFLNWLGVLLRSPGDTEKTMVFVVQTDGLISNSDLRNSHHEPRVLPLDAFDAL